MQDVESREELLAELRRLRARVAKLERERETSGVLLHGDPAGAVGPLVAQVPAAVWATDRALRLTWWTGGAIRSLGLDEPDEMIGVDLYTFAGTRDPEAPVVAAHRRALAGGTGSYELERDGAVVTAHVGPRRDADGAVCGVVGVAIEITDRVRAERELRAALERLRTLSGLIPICMHCKNVRNDGGFWEQVETYVREHSNAEFTHAICPDCMKRVLDADGDRA